MNYRVDHIPKNTAKDRRPGLAMQATTITIHNTGNPSSTAANERGWLTNPSNDRTASFHIVVDEREAIECIPLNENAWHAGDGSGASSGNRTSIGIEICESGNYAKTLENAAELVASMLRERGWGVDRLRRHFDWSGKICPRLMYDNGKWTGWTTFKNMVSARLAAKEDNEEMTPEVKKMIEELQATVQKQNERIKSMEDQRNIPAPEWAKEAAEYYSPHMNPKTGSYDFWRALTIQYRKEKGITV